MQSVVTCYGISSKLTHSYVRPRDPGCVSLLERPFKGWPRTHSLLQHSLPQAKANQSMCPKSSKSFSNVTSTVHRVTEPMPQAAIPNAPFSKPVFQFSLTEVDLVQSTSTLLWGQALTQPSPVFQGKGQFQMMASPSHGEGCVSK